MFTTAGATSRAAPSAATVVALCVDDETPPFAFVTIDGHAAVDEQPGELRRWATRIGGRYPGEERAEEYGRRNAVEGSCSCASWRERASPTALGLPRGLLPRGRPSCPPGR